MAPPKYIDLFMEIKRYGFERSKDDLGYYFTKKDIRISCMKHGSMYLCYYNKLAGKEWILQTKTYQQYTFDKALEWVVRTIQSIGSVY
jgi:hypothetical protein